MLRKIVTAQHSNYIKPQHHFFFHPNSVHCWNFLHYAFQWAENILWWVELKIRSAGEMCELQWLACPKACSKGLNLTCMLRGNMIISAGTVKANIHSTLQKQAQKLRYIVVGSQTGQIQSDAGWDCSPSNWRIYTEQTGVFFLFRRKTLRSTKRFLSRVMIGKIMSSSTYLINNHKIKSSMQLFCILLQSYKTLTLSPQH